MSTNLSKALIAFMSCSMAMSNIAPLNVLANDEGSNEQATTNQNRDKVNGAISDFIGNDVEVANESVKLKNINGDNFAVYNGLNEIANDFHYSADVNIAEGGADCAALLFGFPNKDKPNEDWRGANVINHDGTQKMRFFHGPGNHNYAEMKALEGYDARKKIHLDVDIKADGSFVYTVQSEGGTLNKLEGKMDAWAGGYIGALTYGTEATFSSIQFTDRTKRVVDKFETNLENLHGLSGTWVRNETGLFSSGNGDNFAVSDTKAANFIYSGNIRNDTDKGAGALMFRVQNVNDPKAGCYVINIDFSAKIFKLFSFPSGGTIKEVPLSEIDPKEDGSYDMKVLAVDDNIYIYANGKGIMKVKDNKFKDGNLGLLTWDTTVTYQNIQYEDNATLPDIKEPQLTNFEVLSEGVSITPKFDKTVKDYGMDIPAGVDTARIKLQSEGEIYVTLKNRDGKVIKEKQKVKDVVELHAEDFDVNFLNMVITVEQGGFSEHINVAVNKWLSMDELANQSYRSQFHVTPQVNFMNDPNGLVYDPTDGYWHMHYQYSTKNTFYKQSWAHVRSKDLVNWEQMPLSLQIDEIGVIFSGSAISLTEEEAQNEKVLDGVFKDNKPGQSRLVAFFTYDKGAGYETQSLAYSKDHGTTWTKLGRNVIENPHLTPGHPQYTNDFRDPKVFRVPGDDERWYMIAAGGEARIFTSENLLDWEESQVNLYDKDNNKIVSECPGLNPVTIEGTNTKKWIYNGSDGFYIIGDMVKDEATGIYKWVAESERIGVDSNENPWGGFGKYANMTFFEDGTGKDRAIGVSWLQDTNINFEGKTYWGAQSLPFEWKLKQRTNGEYVVINQPVEEIEKLRDMDNVLYQAKDKKVTDNTKNILQGVSGIRYDLEGTFTLGTAKEFGFKLRKGNGQEVVYTYNTDTKKMTVNIANAGAHQNSGVYSYDLLPLEGNKVKLRMIIDQGAIEAFGNDGEAAISTICYTNNENIGMEFFTSEGDVTIDDLNIYDMKSMYSGKSGSASGDTQLYLSAPEAVQVNEEFTVDTNMYPNLSGDQKIKWSYDKALSVVKQTNGSITFKSDKADVYTIKATNEDGSLSKEIKVHVFVPNFESNIANWDKDNKNWEISDNGMLGKNTGGDSFLMSNTRIYKDQPFVVEADMKIKDGSAAGIVFGVTDKDHVTSHWFCANIDRSVHKAKIFKNENGEKWNVLGDIDGDKTDYHLKITYDGKGKIEYFVNNELIGTKDNADVTDGYIGIQTFNSNTKFDNVNIVYPGATATSVKTEIDIVNVEFDNKDVVSKLPKKVEIEYSNGAILLDEVIWNVEDIDTKKAGLYDVTGTASGLEVKAKVRVIANKADLNKQIEEYMKLAEKDFTQASWKEFQIVLQEAMEVVKNVEVTQDKVSETSKALKSAYGSLEKVADKTALKDVLAKAKAITKEGYTKESFENLQNVIEKAEAVEEDVNATEQQVLAQVKAIEEAIDKLVQVAAPEVDKTALKDAIAKAKDINKGMYTTDSYKALQNAIKTAEAIMLDKDASQDAVDAQVKAIHKAVKDLVIVSSPESNKSELQKAVDGASLKYKPDYTEASWNTFETALQHAKKVLVNDKATSAEIDKALADLKVAEQKLVKNDKSEPVKPTDKEDDKKTENNTPDTGDVTSVGLLGSIVVASGIVLAYMRKRRNES